MLIFAMLLTVVSAETPQFHQTLPKPAEYRAGGKCENFSSRHAASLRILLLIAGIVPNPGPIDFSKLKKPDLQKILNIIHDRESDYVMPSTKEPMIDELKKALENIVRVAMRCVELEEDPPPPPPTGSLGDQICQTSRSFSLETQKYGSAKLKDC